MTIDTILKVFSPAIIAFVFGVVATTPLVRIMHRHKLWKKKAGKVGMDGSDTPIFNELHKNKDTGTPRVGGIIIWLSVIFTTLLFWIQPHIATGSLLAIKLDFLSRNQTWLPFFTLIAASLVGLADDLLQVYGGGRGHSGGLSLTTRILLVLLIGAVGGAWFLKLGNFVLNVPFFAPYDIGVWVVPLYMLVMLALFSGGVIDGIDGLSGGVMAAIFASYAGIAFFQSQYDLATFCAVISGATLAFLWFNIPPAIFYMGESGMLGLTAALAVVAFLTQHVVELLIIALPLFIESGSDIIQVFSKKVRGKKVFLVAPIHHHFEALGWPSYRVTMRFWMVGIISALAGMVIALVG